MKTIGLTPPALLALSALAISQVATENVAVVAAPSGPPDVVVDSARGMTDSVRPVPAAPAASTDSGVVRSVCRLSWPIMLRIVPMMPTFLPACSAIAFSM